MDDILVMIDILKALIKGENEVLSESQKEKLELAAVEIKKRHMEIEKSASSLQDSLDYLRVLVKYLLFDLEATKRENVYLRKMLDGSEEPEN